VALSWSRQRTLVVLGAAGWAVAGLIAWALVSRIAWFGVALIGLAILFVAARWQIGDQNALPTNPTGAGHLYTAQYERQFARSPEEAASRKAAEAEFNRVLYVARTIGLALLLLGANMFIVHQLYP
jgi:hypothetical protein